MPLANDVLFLIQMTFQIVWFAFFSFVRSSNAFFVTATLFCIIFIIPLILTHQSPFAHCEIVNWFFVFFFSLFFYFKQDFYEKLTVGTVQIESHLDANIFKLAEFLNAEIALNTITDSDVSLMQWLRTTFLYTRTIVKSTLTKNQTEAALKGSLLTIWLMTWILKLNWKKKQSDNLFALCRRKKLNGVIKFDIFNQQLFIIFSIFDGNSLIKICNTCNNNRKWFEYIKINGNFTRAPNQFSKIISSFCTCWSPRQFFFLSKASSNPFQ